MTVEENEGRIRQQDDEGNLMSTMSNFESLNKIPNYSTRCGIASYRPNWLQMFASKKWYAYMYSLVLLTDFMQSTYFFGTLSTIEKNFEMSATKLGILRSTFEIGYIISSASFAYFIGKGNKIRWIFGAVLINGIFTLARIVPHYMDANPSAEFQNISQVQNNETWVQKDVSLVQYAFYIFILAQVMAGSGRAITRTSGYTYLDHNSRKNAFPILFAVVASVGSLGGSIGYLIGFYALKIYVNPNEPVNYTPQDYEWIGAWWLGWIPISVIYFALSLFIIIFPESLPRAVLRKTFNHESRSDKSSVSDFYASCKRILSNKIVILDVLSDIVMKVTYSGYEIFLPKYLESQYGLSSSSSSLSLAILKIIERPAGMMATGFSVSKFKPKPRLLIKYNVIMRLIQIGVMTSSIFISCPQPKIQRNWTRDGLDLTTQCNINYNCTGRTKYSPVCNVERKLFFFSPCHAGCSSTFNAQKSKVYLNCSCVPNFESVNEGVCPTECKSAVIMFLVVNAIFSSFILAPVRFAKKIFRFRIVNDEDKSLHYGIRKFLPSAFALLSSIIYGSMIDQSCTVFEKTNRGKGHCLIYNLTTLRYAMNLFAISGIFINVVLEMFLWYYVKDVKMYDEDFQPTNPQIENKKIETEDALIQK